MKILFVHPSVELYGADKILLYILQMLCKKHEITVLVPKEGVLLEHIKQVSSKIKIKVFSRLPVVHSKLKIKDYLFLPVLIMQCRKIFNGEKFDFVFCNTLAAILLLFAGFAKSRVLYVHEIISNPVLNLGFSVLAKIGAKKTVCVSEHVKRNLLFSKNYSVVHNGIPDIAVSHLENKIVPDGKLRFVLPGRFMRGKGQWFLLDTVKELPDSYRNKILFELYGSAPPFKPEFYEELKNLIKTNGFEKQVLLHDFTQNIEEIYSTANVVLVPSIMADPFPTTVLEAMMFSRPLIATKSGGAVEILEDSFSRTISPGNVKEFCRAIEYFIDNKDSLEKYSHSARNKFTSYLTLKNYEERFFEAFRELK